MSDIQHPTSILRRHFLAKNRSSRKTKKHTFVWNTKIFYPANFEVERIKAAKVVPRRVFQASFAPTVYGLRTGLIRSINMFFGLSFILKSASVSFELCLKYLIRRPVHVKFLVGKFHSISDSTKLLPSIFIINTTIHPNNDIAVRMGKLFTLLPFPAFHCWTTVTG